MQVHGTWESNNQQIEAWQQFLGIIFAFYKYLTLWSE